MLNPQEKETTSIIIDKMTYNITSDEWQPVYIKKLGELLENEMQKVEKEIGIVDSYKLLVLSSLRIIDKMLNIKKSNTGSSDFFEQEINKLNSQIENIL